MDIWQILRITLRRWYVALPIALLAVVASYAAADRVAVEYTSSASVLLVNPEPLTDDPAADDPIVDEDAEDGLPLVGEDPSTDVSTTEADGSSNTGNPWLSFSGSLNTAAQAIQLSVSSQDTRALLEQEGLSPAYTVTPDRRNPILVVEATADDPATTQQTLERVLALVSADLDQRQVSAGAPTENRIRIEVLAMDTTPARATAAKLRVQILTLALGLTVALLAAVGFDSLARGRRSGDASTPTDGPAPEEDAEHEAEAEAEAVLVLTDEGAAWDESQDEAATFAERIARAESRQGFVTWTSRAPDAGSAVGVA